MNDMKIEVELLSESIFSASEDANNSVDMEVLYDEVGIPYFKGSSFKGRLRDELFHITKILYEKNNKEIIENIFGKEDGNLNNEKTVRFSNLSISEDIKEVLRDAVSKLEINKEEVLNALTDIRYFSSIDNNGVSKEGSLRQARVVKRGVKYYTNVSCQRTLNDEEKGILALGVMSLTSIGAMQSRGKGEVKCSLLENGKDVTKIYINNLQGVIL